MVLLQWRWHYLDQNEAMVTNIIVDGWKIDVSGAATLA